MTHHPGRPRLTVVVEQRTVRSPREGPAECGWGSSGDWGATFVYIGIVGGQKRHDDRSARPSKRQEVGNPLGQMQLTH